nr:immunoglobulin heavy chain junction region [Macaca mulatta]
CARDRSGSYYYGGSVALDSW